MATPLEVLQGFERRIADSADLENPRLELLPPLTAGEVERLKSQIPCPIPEEAAELFRYARGFKIRNPLLHGAHRELSKVDLSGLDAEFGLKQIFPHALSMADDGCGNYWVVDLTNNSTSWGPIFYACHDAPVVVYQTESLAHFIEHVLKGGVDLTPNHNELDAVHEELATRIWRENPGALDFEECSRSEDPDLKAFAMSLDASYQFTDLRTAKLGDGFSWGRYGPWTVNKRFGGKRIFAYQKKTRRQKFKQLWKR
ncbi:MAG TPA: SMI1/KNR4 family protein [Candidatus Acidoferrum sp.]|nr:SMI1/KNR4 family protein [Candidatus Acidoferrum sp.]